MPRHKPLIRTILEPLAVAIALAMLVRTAVHIYSVPSRSMAPSLEAGDTILVTPYFGSGPERGDVIVFESPANGDELLVKRVIGVAGDLVDSRLGRVRIGGHTIPEPYVARPAASGAIDAQIVPADSYFVLGDNRDDSLDSRSWGVVPRSRVVGRVRMVLWSPASPVGGAVNARQLRTTE
jgi:signal peptidase I